MAKNNALINTYKNLQRKTAETLPNLYAAMAIALWEGLAMPEADKVEAITDIFTRSQELWQDCVDNDVDLLKMCEELTGIDIMRG